jgi:hypothetical protein
MVLNSNLYS